MVGEFKCRGHRGREPHFRSFPLTAAHEIFRIMQDYGRSPNLLDSILLILLVLSSFRRARPIIGGALPANRNLRRRVATCARAVRR